MSSERIDSPDDPRIGPYREVSDRRWLEEHGWFVAEGRSVIEIVLRDPELTIESLLLSPSAHEALLPELEQRREARVFVCSRAVMRQTSGVPFHQGAVALVRRPQRPRALSAMLGRGDAPLRLLIAEDVTDPDNVGALFRNAFAFGSDGVVLSPGCASPYYRKCVRTSIGATLRVPFVHAETWPQVFEACRDADVALVALTTDGAALSLCEWALEAERLPRKLALCVGNEGRGLSHAVLDRCSERVRIPMTAGADSINVATAAAIALSRVFELDAAAGIRSCRDPE